MNGIVGRTHFRLMDAPTKLLRPQTAMNQPLLKPGRLERILTGPSEEAANVRLATRNEARLDLSGLVRVGRIQIWVDIENGVGALVEQNQSGVVERLVEKVVMHPLRQRSAGVNVSRRRVGHPLAVRRNTRLKDEPFGIARQVINSSGR